MFVAAGELGTLIEQAVREYPDYAVLGEERLETILDDVRRTGGGAFEFHARAAEARRLLDVEQAKSEASKSVADLVAQEVEARLAELGLKDREAKTKAGDAPVEGVTTTPSVKAPRDETYETMSRKYGEGDVTWDEFKPYFEEHSKTRRMR